MFATVGTSSCLYGVWTGGYLAHISLFQVSICLFCHLASLLVHLASALGVVLYVYHDTLLRYLDAFARLLHSRHFAVCTWPVLVCWADSACHSVSRKGLVSDGRWVWCADIALQGVHLIHFHDTSRTVVWQSVPYAQWIHLTLDIGVKMWHAQIGPWQTVQTLMTSTVDHCHWSSFRGFHVLWIYCRDDWLLHMNWLQVLSIFLTTGNLLQFYTSQQQGGKSFVPSGKGQTRSYDTVVAGRHVAEAVLWFEIIRVSLKQGNLAIDIRK